MSLATVIVKEDYIITGSDTAVIAFADEESREMIPTDFRREKTMQLTTKVLLLATGKSILTEIIKVELQGRLELDSDLQHCRKVAQEVVNDMRNGIIPSIDMVRTRLIAEMDLPYLPDESYVFDSLSFMDNKADFSVLLAGFNKDGTSGVVDVNEDMLSQPKERGGFYPIGIIGHHPGNLPGVRTEYVEELTLAPEHRSIENFVKAISVVHAIISHHSPVNVSSDCVFRVFQKDKRGLIHYSHFSIDTFPFYERLGLS